MFLFFRNFHMRITAASPVYSVKPSNREGDKLRKKIQTKNTKYILEIEPR